MLICTPAVRNRPVNVALVNWLPWSVLKIVGRSVANARASVSSQNCPSTVTDSSHAST